MNATFLRLRSTLASAKKNGKIARAVQLGRIVLITICSIRRYKEFKEFNKRICVATDVFGRGIDIERINLAINYDMPGDADSYLHRVGRAGRFGTKGLAISFVSSDDDKKVLSAIGTRFEVAIPYVYSLYPHSRRGILLTLL